MIVKTSVPLNAQLSVKITLEYVQNFNCDLRPNLITTKLANGDSLGLLSNLPCFHRCHFNFAKTWLITVLSNRLSAHHFFRLFASAREFCTQFSGY